MRKKQVVNAIKDKAEIQTRSSSWKIQGHVVTGGFGGVGLGNRNIFEVFPMLPRYWALPKSRQKTRVSASPRILQVHHPVPPEEVHCMQRFGRLVR